MGDRHQARRAAVQLLFQRDFNPGDLEEAFGLFWTQPRDEEGPVSDRVRTFAERLVRGVEEQRGELDERLGRYAEHWDVARMNAVDRNIMRLALYEVFFCPDVPPVVAINEAVEAAKELSGLESGRFVNGVLDRALEEVRRPPRVAGEATGRTE